MTDRDENGKFMADPKWIRHRLELREKLKMILSAGVSDVLPIVDIQWAGKVVREKPEWARDIILKYGG